VEDRAVGGVAIVHRRRFSRPRVPSGTGSQPLGTPGPTGVLVWRQRHVSAPLAHPMGTPGPTGVLVRRQRHVRTPQAAIRGFAVPVPGSAARLREHGWGVFGAFDGPPAAVRAGFDGPESIGA
jgi:hypothetical protein